VIPLAIWLFILGYTIVITGKRNLGLSYAPQSDGSIKAVDGQGNQARTYSLMDVITCADASGQPQGQTAPATGTPRVRNTPPPALGAPNPNLIPLPNLNPLPKISAPRLPAPNPSGLLSGLEGLEREIAGDVYSGVNGLAGGLRDALKRLQLPQLGRTPGPAL